MCYDSFVFVMYNKEIGLRKGRINQAEPGGYFAKIAWETNALRWLKFDGKEEVSG